MKRLFSHQPPPSAAGEGVHAWLFHMGCRVAEEKIPHEEAIPYIRALMPREPAPPQEIEHALDAASGEGRRKPTQKWPNRCFNDIQKIFKHPLPDWKPTDISAEQAIDTLFPGNPLLCVGLDSARFQTKPREAHRGSLSKASLIVPSPMSARQGRTKAGHLSMHSVDNTGDRYYLITEWDWGTPDNHLRLIRHLAAFGPLAAVVLSGGKSTHGWWDVRGVTEDAAKEFFMRAIVLGADPRLWLKSQFCRMPGGQRQETGKRQEILFLDANRPKS